MAADCAKLLAWLVLCGSLATLQAQDGVIQMVSFMNATDYEAYNRTYGGLLDRGYKVFMERFKELHPDGILIGDGPHRFVFNYSIALYGRPGAAAPSMRQAVREQVAQGAHFLLGWADPGMGLLAEEFNRITLDCCYSDSEEDRRAQYFQMHPPLENDLDKLMNVIALKVRNTKQNMALCSFGFHSSKSKLCATVVVFDLLKLHSSSYSSFEDEDCLSWLCAWATKSPAFLPWPLSCLGQ